MSAKRWLYFLVGIASLAAVMVVGLTGHTLWDFTFVVPFTWAYWQLIQMNNRGER